MTIGLICAIPQELAYLRSCLEQARSTEIAHTAFVEGILDGQQVVLVGTGMGKVNAALVTTVLLDRFRCRVAVFSGVAGGLDPALAIGDVVIADKVLQWDAGMIEDERLTVYQPGYVPRINPTDSLGYHTDRSLLARVRDRLDGVRLPVLTPAEGGQDRPPSISYATVLTGDAYLHCEKTRERLHRDLGGVAIEMEGGAVAQTCAAFGVPWLVIRALSDLAGRDAQLDFVAFVDGVAEVSARIVRRIIDIV